MGRRTKKTSPSASKPNNLPISISKRRRIGGAHTPRSPGGSQLILNLPCDFKPPQLDTEWPQYTLGVSPKDGRYPLTVMT